jgi:hypothetical protein
MKSGIIGLAALALGGCATITRGSDELVAFQSEPPGAAVRTSIGAGCPTTPCSISVPRKDPFVASFELPGYRGEQVTVGTRMSGGGTAGVVGNVLFGGVIGVVVDSSSGAGLDHYPNPVMVQLEPLRPVSPLIERRPRRRSAPSS